jgi:IS30 family transposase
MKHLTIEQRYQIEAYLNLGAKKHFIANEFGVHVCSIYREIGRNKKRNGGYSAKIAQEFSSDRKDRFTVNRTFTDCCQRMVVGWLHKYWSPEQISGYCKKNNIEMVSAERIYQLKHRSRPVGKHYPIANRVSIDDRPEVVNAKERFGDWEMDTIIGLNNEGAILTLTERKTNFIIIEKLGLGKNAEGVKKQVIEKLLPYKNVVYTITTDNGGEFAEHLEICKKLKTTIYFTHPYSSWEKGSIENANKLIRQYVPKKSNFSDITQEQLTDIQHKLNSRPRKKLGYETPKEIFYKFIQGNFAFGS